MHRYPGDDGNLRGLQKFFRDVLVHADCGAKNAGADERESGEIEQTLDRSVFAVGSVHHRKNDIEFLRGRTSVAAVATELNQGNVGWVCRHRDRLAAMDNFLWQHVLRART